MSSAHSAWTGVLVLFVLFAHLVTAAAGNNITFQPDGVLEDFYENEEIVIRFNLTDSGEINHLMLTAVTQDEVIAVVVANATQRIDDLLLVNGVYTGQVTVKGKRLGRTDVEFFLNEVGTIPNKDDLLENALRVVVLRKRRVVDDVFRYGIIALAAILYIGFGCKINLKLIWKILRRPISPAIGFASQFVIMPLLAFGLGQAFGLEDALGFGLLTLACSPGGGSSNVWVNLFDGDLDLSLTMTTVSTFASLGMMPFWLYAFGHLYLNPRDISIPFVDIVRSLLTIIIPCAVGVVIRRFVPKAADKIAWFTRPFSGIFVIYILTFGTYVNLYMYEIMGNDPFVIPAAILLPVLGYCCGLILALVTRRDKSTAATISIETGVQNASIPIIILQGSFPQPEGDVAAVMPVAASLFYTIPIIIAWFGFLAYRHFHPPQEDDLDLPSDKDIKSYDLSGEDNAEKPGDPEKGLAVEPATLNGTVNGIENGIVNGGNVNDIKVDLNKNNKTSSDIEKSTMQNGKINDAFQSDNTNSISSAQLY